VHLLMRIIGPTATYIGRKTSLWISVILIYVANIVMMTTDNIAGLYAGRLVIGLGNGFLMTFSQLYIQVFSLPPKKSWPALICSFQTIGVFAGSISRSHVRCIPILDLIRFPPRSNNRQFHSKNRRQKQLYNPPRFNIYHTCVPMRRNVIHPRVTPMVTSTQENRGCSEGIEMAETR